MEYFSCRKLTVSDLNVVKILLCKSPLSNSTYRARLPWLAQYSVEAMNVCLNLVHTLLLPIECTPGVLIGRLHAVQRER